MRNLIIALCCVVCLPALAATKDLGRLSDITWINGVAGVRLAVFSTNAVPPWDTTPNVLWWDFNDPVNLANDSGNTNRTDPMFISGAIQTNDVRSGATGNSYYFDGANDFLQTTNTINPAFVGTGARSVSFWTKTMDMADASVNPSWFNVGSAQWLIYYHTGLVNPPTYEHFDGAAVKNSGIKCTSTWTHVALTWNGANLATLYVGGTNKVTTTVTPTISAGEFMTLAVRATAYMNCYVDDLYVFNSEISSGYVFSIAQSNVYPTLGVNDAKYTFDETVTNFFYDKVGNVYSGQTVNAIFQRKSGNGNYYWGVGTQTGGRTITNSTLFPIGTFTSNATFSAWVNAYAPAQFATVFSLSSNATPIVNFGMQAAYLDASSIGTNLYIQADGANSLTSTTNGSWKLSDKTNAWHHVAAVINGAAGTGKWVTIYVDGAEQGLSAVTNYNNISLSTVNKVYIGARGDASWYWGGAIDDPRIWNISLLATNIIDLYSGGRK